MLMSDCANHSSTVVSGSAAIYFAAGRLVVGKSCACPKYSGLVSCVIGGAVESCAIITFVFLFFSWRSHSSSEPGKAWPRTASLYN